jgi:tryptophan synthase alpha chain
VTPPAGTATAPRRLRAAFARAAREGRKGLVPYLTVGYPDPATTARAAIALLEEGALAVELGIPFSDPLADGPELQRASHAALARGTRLADAFDTARRIRASRNEPIVLMTYLNPVLAAGLPAFLAEARAAGVDGLLVSDLPPDEGDWIWKEIRRSALDPILLVAPTTPTARVGALARRARGFLYCVSRLGVTGRGAAFDPALAGRLREVRRATRLPIALGFGISGPGAIREVKDLADAFVVGAAMMEAIGGDGAADERVARVRALGRSLLDALA